VGRDRENGIESENSSLSMRKLSMWTGGGGGGEVGGDE
jgi:hypothetical protein